MFARWRAATVLATVLAVAPAHADAVANFYKHRQVDLIVGSGPGGGYDIYARLLARHFGKFIPGHPPIIVQNMPGGGLLGGNANVQFDPRRLTWLGSASSLVNDAYILIVRKDAPVKSIDEARRADLPGLVLGATADGGTGNDVPI